MITLFSTNRAIREFYANFANLDTLLPKAITISQFESKAITVKDRVFIDDDTRFLLLRDAADFQEFKKLEFDSDFLTFLSHSKYIFAFFEELASQEIEIEDLKEFDTYALFSEHLELLETLKRRYISLLDSKKYVDKINQNSLYSLNVDYLKNLEKIELRLDGYLSKFEIDLFEKCSSVIPFFIKLDINIYNLKLKEIFGYFGFELELNNSYTLNLTERKIVEKKSLKHKDIVADTKVFNTRISQVGYVLSSIEKFVKSGIMPENIVVVLPDESLAPFLKEFDRYNNLNFAMGFSLKNSQIYKKIKAIELYINISKDEQKTRIKRLNIENSLLLKIKGLWRKKVPCEKAIEIINEILDPKEGEDELIKEQIFRFKRFLENIDFLNLEQIFRLFLKRLMNVKRDDVRGGKITVMGVLETRGCSYEGVIVPDFSDEFVPRRSNKDLFLNTQIRKNIGLPTRKDRENLQKYYYYKLFQNAKKISICAVANETTMPSRFLDELNLNYENSCESFELFPKSEFTQPKVPEIKDTHYRLDLETLSSTKLSTILTCRRKFYYKYIKKLKEPKNIVSETNAKIGLNLHKALEKVFAKGQDLSDTKKVKLLLKEFLMSDCSDDKEEFELDIWIMQLENFIQNEAKRYKDGYRLYGNELEFSCKFEGFEIDGKIDRVDIKDDKLIVIDYKSGDVSKLMKQKLDNTTNFQLEFYYLLASGLKEVSGVYYYDLKSGKLVPEDKFREKIDKLKDILKALKKPITSFELCEKRANCVYCPYKKLCLRDN